MRGDRTRIVVLGVGNLLLKDEGVGVHVVRALEDERAKRTRRWEATEQAARLAGAEIEIIDGGTSPDIAFLAQGADTLIVVDAVRAGGPPGSVYRLAPDEVDAQGCSLASLHQLSLMDNLAIAELLGNQPAHTVIIGIEPESIEIGLELTEAVQSRVSDVVEIVLNEVTTACHRAVAPGRNRDSN